LLVLVGLSVNDLIFYKVTLFERASFLGHIPYLKYWLVKFLTVLLLLDSVKFDSVSIILLCSLLTYVSKLLKNYGNYF
jgi:hypothetical protein